MPTQLRKFSGVEIWRPALLLAAAVGLLAVSIGFISPKPLVPTDVDGRKSDVTPKPRDSLRGYAVTPRPGDHALRRGSPSSRANLPSQKSTSPLSGDPLRALEDVLLAGGDLGTVRHMLASAMADGGPAVTDYVYGLLMDREAALSVRVEAALSLGAYGGTAGAEYLRQAFNDVDDDLLIGPILDGLARTPFDAENGLLAELIRDSESSLENRISALEALGEFTPRAGDFLLQVAGEDPSPTIRRTAAEAAMLVSEDDGAAPALARLALQEDDAGVRAAFYAAIATDNYDLAGLHETDALVQLIAEETLPRARLDGAGMLAAAINAGNAGLTAGFDAHHVPWLLKLASGDPGRPELSLALAALSLAHSERAQAALNELSNSQRIEVAEAAGDALARMTKQ